jgi:hypothetical protein
MDFPVSDHHAEGGLARLMVSASPIAADKGNDPRTNPLYRGVPSNASGSSRRHLARLVGDPRHQTRGANVGKRLDKRKNIAVMWGKTRAAASPRKIIAPALPSSQEAEMSLCDGWLFSGYR